MKRLVVASKEVAAHAYDSGRYRADCIGRFFTYITRARIVLLTEPPKSCSIPFKLPLITFVYQRKSLSYLQLSICKSVPSQCRVVVS
jgi:hypothetical protein